MKSTSRELAEPTRLLASGTAYQRRLLESAELDVMPSGTPERLARALGEPGLAAPSGKAERFAVLARRGSRRWVRLGSVGGLGGLGLLAALLAGHPSNDPPAAPASSASAAVVVEAAVIEPAVMAEPAATPVAAPVNASPGALGSRRPAAAAARAVRRPAAPAAPVSDGLLEEARLLERARAALRAGQSGSARQLLDQYRARFAHGELAFEAALLEAERVDADGDAPRARLLARELLDRPGAARYRARLSRLMQGSDRTPTNMDGQRSNP